LRDEDRPEHRKRDKRDRGAGRGPAPAAIGDPTPDRRGNSSRNALHPRPKGPPKRRRRRRFRDGLRNFHPIQRQPPFSNTSALP
jgi:hypothetical protein